MNEQLLYIQDPLKLEFDALVRQKLSLPDGRLGVILDASYFYPTGGGQEHDTGTLGEARVVDVFKDGETPVLIHVVDRDIPLGSVHARIDAPRRLRFMQHHTAQHLLSQCFLRLLDMETLSANINCDTPSTIDFPYTQLSTADVDPIENLANQIIYENRQVKTYFVTPQELERVPLRRPPKVSEDIRIVEIDGFDYSACGGTHCLQTGTIGVVKILRTERQNEKTRLHFVAGWQALERFREYYILLINLASRLNTGFPDLPEALQRQAEQLKSLQRELQALRLEKIAWEARSLADSAQRIGVNRLVLASFENRPVSELRLLADELKKLPSLIALLASYDSQKISLLVTCAPNTSLDARQVLQQQLAPFGGRGGGDPQLAQGGGPATPEQFRTFFDITPNLVATS